MPTETDAEQTARIRNAHANFWNRSKPMRNPQTAPAYMGLIAGEGLVVLSLMEPCSAIALSPDKARELGIALIESANDCNNMPAETRLIQKE